MGFSIAIRSAFAAKNRIKNTAPFARSTHRATTFSGAVHRKEKLRVATLLRYVQGGCAISKSHFPISCVLPSIVTIRPPLNSFQGIAQDVPFWVSAGRFLNIAAVCFKSSGTECLANGLRFFTGNKNFVCHFTHFPCFHLSMLPYSSQMIAFLIPLSHSWVFQARS